MFEVEEKRDLRRTISLLLILVGVATVGVDVASILTKKELCPFQGCRLAASSHYASIFGIPLPLLGMGFFVVALILVFHRRSLRLWLALGTGFSLYLVMVQFLVLHKICPLCMVVETVTLLLLIVNWSWNDAKLTLPLLLFAFLTSHMLYFPPFPLTGSFTGPRPTPANQAKRITLPSKSCLKIFSPGETTRAHTVADGNSSSTLTVRDAPASSKP